MRNVKKYRDKVVDEDGFENDDMDFFILMNENKKRRRSDDRWI